MGGVTWRLNVCVIIAGKFYKVMNYIDSMRGSSLFGVYFVVVVFMLMSLGFVAGVEFTASGCDFGGGVTLAPDTCSFWGDKYCGSDLTAYDDTTKDYEGCSLGENSYDFGDRQCCPKGFLCDLNSSAPLTCFRVVDITECATITTNDECSEVGCFWIESEGCVDAPNEFSCSSYVLEEECDTDAFNLGKEGVGAQEFCDTEFTEAGGVYIIPATSCECEWNGSSCNLRYSVIPDFYDVYISFNCSASFDVGECVDGKKSVSWEAGVSESTSAFDDLNQTDKDDIIAAAKCEDGSGVRLCGQPLARLPGFSLFALFFSLGIIGMFYFLRERKSQDNEIYKCSF